MEYVNLIVNVIGFVGLAWIILVLREKIKSQKEILDSQNDIIKSMKMFVDIYEPEKIKEFVKMREQTFEDQKNKDIEKMKSEMEKALGPNSTLVADVLKLFMGEIGSLLKIVLNLAYYVRPDFRKTSFENSPNSHIKTLILNEINKSPYYGDVYASELRKILSEKGSLSDHIKVDKS